MGCGAHAAACRRARGAAAHGKQHTGVHAVSWRMDEQVGEDRESMSMGWSSHGESVTSKASAAAANEELGDRWRR